MIWLQNLLSANFAQHVLNSRLWIMTAENLISASECLAIEIENFWRILDQENNEPIPLTAMIGSQYHNIFMMLQGFAIENFCKAYVVTQLSVVDRVRLRAGALPGSLKSHRLQELVEKKILLELDGQESELLKRLEAAVVWAGRYPVSTGPAGRREIREQLRAMPQGLRRDDVIRTRLLTDRIKEHVIRMLPG